MTTTKIVKMNLPILLEECFFMLGVLLLLLLCDPVAYEQSVAHASYLFMAGSMNSNSIHGFNSVVEMLGWFLTLDRKMILFQNSCIWIKNEGCREQVKPIYTIPNLAPHEARNCLKYLFTLIKAKRKVGKSVLRKMKKQNVKFYRLPTIRWAV